MLKINEKVIHAREGLSTVVNYLTMGDKDYYVIQADNGKGDNIYVLQNNTANIIRPIMNVEEAHEVIRYMKEVKAEFVSNTKQRRDLYKRKLLSGNVNDLAYLSRQLFFFNYYNANGQLVKLGPTDLQMLKDAESILLDEMALSLNVNRDLIKEHIEKIIG